MNKLEDIVEEVYPSIDFAFNSVLKSYTKERFVRFCNSAVTSGVTQRIKYRYNVSDQEAKEVVEKVWDKFHNN